MDPNAASTTTQTPASPTPATTAHPPPPPTTTTHHPTTHPPATTTQHPTTHAPATTTHHPTTHPPTTTTHHPTTHPPTTTTHHPTTHAPATTTHHPTTHAPATTTHHPTTHAPTSTTAAAPALPALDAAQAGLRLQGQSGGASLTADPTATVEVYWAPAKGSGSADWIRIFLGAQTGSDLQPAANANLGYCPLNLGSLQPGLNTIQLIPGTGASAAAAQWNQAGAVTLQLTINGVLGFDPKQTGLRKHGDSAGGASLTADLTAGVDAYWVVNGFDQVQVAQQPDSGTASTWAGPANASLGYCPIPLDAVAAGTYTLKIVPGKSGENGAATTWAWDAAIAVQLVVPSAAQPNATTTASISGLPAVDAAQAGLRLQGQTGGSALSADPSATVEVYWAPAKGSGSADWIRIFLGAQTGSDLQPAANANLGFCPLNISSLPPGLNTIQLIPGTGASAAAAQWNQAGAVSLQLTISGALGFDPKQSGLRKHGDTAGGASLTADLTAGVDAYWVVTGFDQIQVADQPDGGTASVWAGPTNASLGYCPIPLDTVAGGIYTLKIVPGKSGENGAATTWAWDAALAVQLTVPYTDKGFDFTQTGVRVKGAAAGDLTHIVELGTVLEAYWAVNGFTQVKVIEQDVQTATDSAGPVDASVGVVQLGSLEVGPHTLRLVPGDGTTWNYDLAISATVVVHESRSGLQPPIINRFWVLDPNGAQTGSTQIEAGQNASLGWSLIGGAPETVTLSVSPAPDLDPSATSYSYAPSAEGNVALTVTNAAGSDEQFVYISLHEPGTAVSEHATVAAPGGGTKFTLEHELALKSHIPDLDVGWGTIGLEFALALAGSINITSEYTEPVPSDPDSATALATLVGQFLCFNNKEKFAPKKDAKEPIPEDAAKEKEATEGFEKTWKAGTEHEGFEISYEVAAKDLLPWGGEVEVHLVMIKLEKNEEGEWEWKLDTVELEANWTLADLSIEGLPHGLDITGLEVKFKTTYSFHPSWKFIAKKLGWQAMKNAATKIAQKTGGFVRYALTPIAEELGVGMVTAGVVVVSAVAAVVITADALFKWEGRLSLTFDAQQLAADLLEGFVAGISGGTRDDGRGTASGRAPSSTPALLKGWTLGNAQYPAMRDAAEKSIQVTSDTTDAMKQTLIGIEIAKLVSFNLSSLTSHFRLVARNAMWTQYANDHKDDWYTIGSASDRKTAWAFIWEDWPLGENCARFHQVDNSHTPDWYVKLFPYKKGDS